MAIVDVEDTLYYLEREAAKIRIVNQEYPGFKLKHDTRSGEYEYYSPKVKYSFNDIEIFKTSYYISMRLTRKLDFVFADETVPVIVRNAPVEYALGRIDFSSRSFLFWEKPFTCRDKILKKKAQEAIDIAILDFIRDNPGFALDKNQLSPRLQKLLILT